MAQNETAYVYKDRGDWTAGFFPGTLWLLYERSRDLTNHPLVVSTAEFLSLALQWNSPALRLNKDRTDTHDLGFMMHDSFGWDAILRKNASSRLVVLNAAVALSKRFNPVTKAIRSWGGLTETGSFQVIIDNMMSADPYMIVIQGILMANRLKLTSIRYHRLGNALLGGGRIWKHQPLNYRHNPRRDYANKPFSGRWRNVACDQL